MGEIDDVTVWFWRYYVRSWCMCMRRNRNRDRSMRRCRCRLVSKFELVPKVHNRISQKERKRRK